MALSRRKFHEIPADAVILTEEEAFKYQAGVLNSWKHSKDVFGYRYGVYALGMASFLNGLYINNHYRSKLRLLNYGRLSTFLPLCILPGAFSIVCHAEDLVLRKEGNCPICLEMRGSALQVLVGTVFPCVLAPIATFSLAHRFVTYKLPDIVSQPIDLLRVVKKIKAPILNVLFGAMIGQAVLASAVTYFEGKSIMTVNTRLEQLEIDLENT